MQQSVDDFLKYLEVVRNLSDHTLRNYRADLGAFASFTDLEPGKVDKYLLRDYIAHLNERNLKKTSILRHLSALRSYFKYLTKKKIISSDPMQLVQMPKKPAAVPKALEYAEVERLLESPDLSSYLGVRDRVILELFYSSGLRVSELVGLNRQDFDKNVCCLRVRGKGKKERIIPVTRSAAQWVERYLGHPERHLTIDDHQKQADPNAIFLNRFGRRLTDRSVNRRLKDYLIKANLIGKVTPHTIRHTIATHWLERGMDLKTIQTILGHASLSATTIYTKVTPKLKKRVYDQAHPRAK